MNNNGPLSFNRSFSDPSPDPFPEFNGQALLAAFWDDINIFTAGEIFYRVTLDPVCLERARLDILAAEFNGAEDFNPTYLFIATWYRVAEFGGFSSQVNTHSAACIVMTTNCRSHPCKLPVQICKVYYYALQNLYIEEAFVLNSALCSIFV